MKSSISWLFTENFMRPLPPGKGTELGCGIHGIDTFGQPRNLP
jgi:hypothetical protein